MTSTDLIPAAARDTVIAPLDTNQVKAAMTRYQDGLQSILDTSDWQEFADKKGEKKRFLKRSGWRKIAFWFGLDLTMVSTEVERDSAGKPVRARVVARATHPNGRHADGDGYCSILEPRVFGKPENDIPATAATRAMNRAISNLVGMGEVSAEELDGEEAPAHEHGAPATSREIDGLERALDALSGPDSVQTLVDRLERDAGGYIPRVVARAVMLIAAHRPPPAERGGTGVDAHPQPTPPSGKADTPDTQEVTSTPDPGPPDDQRAT